MSPRQQAGHREPNRVLLAENDLRDGAEQHIYLLLRLPSTRSRKGGIDGRSLGAGRHDGGWGVNRVLSPEPAAEGKGYAAPSTTNLNQGPAFTARFDQPHIFQADITVLLGVGICAGDADDVLVWSGGDLAERMLQRISHGNRAGRRWSCVASTAPT
jgi:hypothetical protein